MEVAEKMKAMQNRDKSYDRQFIFGVKTTKTVCDPGCPPRIPLEENIIFQLTLNDALQNGYCPCKLCKPDILFQKLKQERGRQ